MVQLLHEPVPKHLLDLLLRLAPGRNRRFQERASLWCQADIAGVRPVVDFGGGLFAPLDEKAVEVVEEPDHGFDEVESVRERATGLERLLDERIALGVKPTGLPCGGFQRLAQVIRGRYLVDVQSVTKVKGMAFLADEVEDIIDADLDGSLAEKESDKTRFAKLDGSVFISKRELVHD